MLSDAFSQGASYRFRWVSCQLETLRHSSSQNLRRTLDELPKTLDETYERLLKNISEDNWKYAHRLLHCLAVAVRPLRVEELAEILAFDFDVGDGDIPKFHADRRWTDKEEYAVLSTCSSLISIVEDGAGSRVVQFSHFSVKEFLTSDRLATSTRDVSRYRILSGVAHTIFARACLGPLPQLDNQTDDKSVRNSPLAKYAARHWVAHAQFEDVASRVKEAMEALFDSDKPHFAAWLGIHDMDPPLYWQWESPLMTRNRPDPLYYAALCGFPDLVEHLVIKHPTHVNAIAGKFQSPLLAALHGKHVRVASLLLEHGGKVDLRGTRNQTALHNAVVWSSNIAVDAVQFLLQHGADVNGQRDDQFTPLHLAAEIGEVEVTQMLLDHKADVHSRNIKAKTPLHLMSGREVSQRECNRPRIVELLLAYGADVNARDLEAATPLHDACYRGRLELARVLLGHGASANDEGASQTPLHQVIEGNRDSQLSLSLAELLLDRGADVNSKNRDN